LVKRQYVLLTTSRKPTKSIRTLCNDLSHTFRKAMRINRGKLSLEGIAEKALELAIERVMIVNRWKGGPGKIDFFEIRQDGLNAFPPIIYVRNIKFRREFGKGAPKRIDSVAIATSPKQNFEIKKFENALSGFFDVPILSLEEAINGKHDAIMQVLADSLNCITITFRIIPELVEDGPQIGISHLVWWLIP